MIRLFHGRQSMTGIWKKGAHAFAIYSLFVHPTRRNFATRIIAFTSLSFIFRSGTNGKWPNNKSTKNSLFRNDCCEIQRNAYRWTDNLKRKGNTYFRNVSVKPFHRGTMSFIPQKICFHSTDCTLIVTRIASTGKQEYMKYQK